MGDSGSGDTGGNDESDSGNGWNDESSSTLWGWLDGIVGGLKTVWQAVTNLPSLIADSLKSFFDSIKDAILALPTAILDGIKSIFIPDTEEIRTKFQGFLDELSTRFGFDTSFWDALFNKETAVEDVYANYSFFGLGNMKVKILDASVLHQAVDFFRPIIRGFIVLLLAFYNIKSVLGFIKQDAGVVAGKTEGGNS